MVRVRWGQKTQNDIEIPLVCDWATMRGRSTRSEGQGHRRKSRSALDGGQTTGTHQQRYGGGGLGNEYLQAQNWQVRYTTWGKDWVYELLRQNTEVEFCRDGGCTDRADSVAYLSGIDIDWDWRKFSKQPNCLRERTAPLRPLQTWGTLTRAENHTNQSRIWLLEVAWKKYKTDVLECYQDRQFWTSLKDYGQPRSQIRCIDQETNFLIPITDLQPKTTWTIPGKRVSRMYFQQRKGTECRVFRKEEGVSSWNRPQQLGLDWQIIQI